MIQKLLTIQNELKAPKSQYNSFGKYNYRNQEDILEAVKPLLYAQGLFLSLTDEIVEVAGEFFVKATAIITDGENTHAVTAMAGYEPNKKGMDKSQSAGSSSSYARKYALNGLFLIDDTKDSDFTNKHGKTAKPKATLIQDSEAYVKAAQAIKSGSFTIEAVESKYILTPEVKKSLLKLV
jgi:hypothetical protein